MAGRCTTSSTGNEVIDGLSRRLGPVWWKPHVGHIVSALTSYVIKR
jgi:hypothetical protein